MSVPRWRGLLKYCLPPVIVDLLRGRRQSASVPPPLWEGIYAHRRDVPVEPGSYDDDRRIAEFAAATRQALALQRAGGQPEVAWHDALGLVAACTGEQPEIRVLDFGGALGLSFVHLLATLRGPTRLRYHVVELEGACSAGRALFAGDDRISFHSEIPSLLPVDVVYVSSVLPYLDDYGALLRRLAEVGARHVLLTQLAIGPFATFSARQLNLSGQVLAYRFINRDDLVGVMQECGYALVYESQAGPRYAQENFPESHRLGRMWNLLFRRTGPPSNDRTRERRGKDD